MCINMYRNVQMHSWLWPQFIAPIFLIGSEGAESRFFTSYFLPSKARNGEITLVISVFCAPPLDEVSKEDIMTLYFNF